MEFVGQCVMCTHNVFDYTKLQEHQAFAFAHLPLPRYSKFYRKLKQKVITLHSVPFRSLQKETNDNITDTSFLHARRQTSKRGKHPKPAAFSRHPFTWADYRDPLAWSGSAVKVLEFQGYSGLATVRQLVFCGSSDPLVLFPHAERERERERLSGQSGNEPSGIEDRAPGITGIIWSMG